jgi:rhamnose utilization protein RhaD (predicted bifunctional aldolase and dehydrogenase)/NAD(P)-dependent dehydrogenase (short-subunit alcohol dehydrogenase family)
MESRWSDADARDTVAGFKDVGEDLALRVYTSRLLGRERTLVLHGGGNTSVKTRTRDLLGNDIDVLCVKGSGWDMAEIEPPGLPAVRLDPLKKLQALDRLTDEDMVNYLRGNLLDAAAPNPSVETLLHAFLPHKFVDHTHADAILALTDRRDGAKLCEDLFDGKLGIVPYIMPGFALAKLCAAVYAKNPNVEGLVLLKHGLFTFGATAREAYERTVAAVTVAEKRLARGGTKKRPAAKLPNDVPALHEIAPRLRGLLGREQLQVLEFRNSPAVMEHVNGAELARYALAGPVTPDHVIRTKPWPMIFTTPQALEDYIAKYRAYFARHDKGDKKALDPLPRVVLVPGLGLFGVGKSHADAVIAADLAEAAIAVISATEAETEFESITEQDMFDMEYWSLEQAKLGKAAEKRLARHVVAVTGGASGIGAATAKAFRAEGVEVAVLDIAGGKGVIECDVTDASSVRAAFREVVARYGGVDIVVSNAGRAYQGKIGEVPEQTLRESFEINFYGHQRVAQEAVAIMRAQGTGGAILFNVSKQAVNPGPDFGPYGLPKAATLALMKQYALDHGADGIRANAVNADRIRTGLLTDKMIAARAKARGVSEKEYMEGNLLGREVTAEDVARAFVELALARATTAAVLMVDGGNVAASLR